MRPVKVLILLAAFAFLAAPPAIAAEKNLIADPSFELTKPKDQFGLVFAKWGGWKYEGDCEFKVGQVAHSGNTSCCLFGASAPKIRIRAAKVALEPGRYKVTAYLRGLDIGSGTWNRSTEFEWLGDYMSLDKNGTFGWSEMTYVADVKEAKEVEPLSFGLWAPGYFWIDDVSLVKVDSDAALTPKPVIGKEESAIAPPGPIDDKTAVRCVECGYRNDPSWGKCYACGTALPKAAAAKAAATGPSVKMIASFETGAAPFSPGTVVAEHATDGTKALKVDGGYVSDDVEQSWVGFDFLKVDVFNASDKPTDFTIEVRDSSTKDYWTRVNYNTIAPPGASTIIMPATIYVGEKSRPGRMLDKAHVTRLVFGIPEKAEAPVFIDNVRLERDDSAAKVQFDGLYAFDLGTDSSPVMEGFTKFTPATIYSKGRGYGLKDAQVLRAVDALQPDPLYEDFLCIGSGGIAVDVPNGKYHVFVNMDSPSDFWGDYQVYRERSITANGVVVVKDTLDFASFTKKYYRFSNTDDTPADNTFDKYQVPYFKEKEFDVDVKDGQLFLEFKGQGYACTVSCVVIYPASKAAQGKAFLDYLTAKRRFYFNNYFKRTLHNGTNPDFAATDAEKAAGYVLFDRGFMNPVYYNDKPSKEEIVTKLSVSAFAGQSVPVTFSVLPLQNLGTAQVSGVKELSCDAGVIPGSAIEVGYVSYRLSRVTMEGSVYTIAPLLIMPRGSVRMPQGITRTWWLTVNVPADAKPGVYKGNISFFVDKDAHGSQPITWSYLPFEVTVHKGALDPVDIPAGPWGHTIDTPWFGDDPAAKTWNARLASESLAKLREYGFTTFSGLPVVAYKGMKDGVPEFDFSQGDAQMKRARDAGFTMPVVNYTAFGGLDLYFEDEAAMKAAGFSDYSAFIKKVFTAVEDHAKAANWLPVYWNLCDEPIGDNLTRSIENARAYRKAFPVGPPFFSGATSVEGDDPSNPHLALATALHVADVNGHDEASITAIHKAGSNWAFYNGGNRWTYGIYMYKAAKEFDMKFRLSWHWNNVAGDPYYALDCREDDYAWCNSSPDGELIPAVHFEELRAGLDDYRMMLTLARLAKEKKGKPEAAAAEKLINTRLAAFKLGQRDHDAIFGADDWAKLRAELTDAIDGLRK